MRILKKIALTLSVLFLPLSAAMAADSAVVEIVTFNLKNGVTYEEFHPLDRAVEEQHVSKQTGFISRESASGEKGQWLVIVRWDSAEAADASMNTFMSAPAAAKFVENLDSSSMVMTRYNVISK